MMEESMNVDIQAINEKIKKESVFVDKIMNEVGKVIVGGFPGTKVTFG